MSAPMIASLWRTSPQRVSINVTPCSAEVTKSLLRITGGRNAVLVTHGSPELQISLRDEQIPAVAGYLGLSDYDINRLLTSKVQSIMLKQTLSSAS